MYDESILELEEVEGEDRWHQSVVEASYKTYRDAKEWELAMTMARELAEGLPESFEWLKKVRSAAGLAKRGGSTNGPSQQVESGIFPARIFSVWANLGNRQSLHS